MRLLSPFIAICACLAAALPLRAQIVRVADENGHAEYVNAAVGSNRKQPAKSAKRANAAQKAPRLAAGELDSLVGNTARRHRLDPALIHAVIHAESGGNAAAVSRKGAQGLMQLMPQTAARLGVADSFNPASNLEGGARYLRALLERYHGNLEESLAAYNAGEEAVDRSGGIPNYPETRAYVREVIGNYFQTGPQGHLARAAGSRGRIRAELQDGRLIYTNE